MTFVFTRLLAEGVRLFASAIPIKLLLDEFGVTTSYGAIIVVLTAITVVYTYLGGIKAVIWTDAIQMGLYLGGAVLAIIVLSATVGGDGFAAAAAAGKFQVFDPNFSLAHILTSPFALPTAIIGGAIFAMASHGSDQLIVQRVLATRSLRDSQKAMIGSGIFVLIQFAAFSLVGALLWCLQPGPVVPGPRPGHAATTSTRRSSCTACPSGSRDCWWRASSARRWARCPRR